MHLSDLHINMTRISAERIKKAVKAEKPDLILITGDYINKPVHASDFYGTCVPSPEAAGP